MDTELDFVAAAEAAAPPAFRARWSADAAIAALRDGVAAIVEDDLRETDLDFDDSELPTRLERLGAFAKRHRGLALRAGSLALNVVQARVAVAAARRAAEKRDDDVPKFPLF